MTMKQASLPLELSQRWKLAVDLAHEAGKSTLNYFRRGVDYERKPDQSPVTVADREAELLARERIARVFPNDAILGEEFGSTTGTSGYRWVIDPIDGTKSFISGVPLYSTLVGVLHEEKPVVGVIYIPALDEGVHAARGGGAWYFSGGGDDVPTTVSSRSCLSDGLFVTSQVDSYYHRGAGSVFSNLEKKAYVTRTWGDGYGYLLVATGRAEVMVDPLMQVWDAAAIQPILEEAGGVFVDWQGQPTVFSGEGIATNRHLLPEVLEITRRAPRLPSQ
jgi:histidinol phosphatase-like enzyme (inositol monophosphatase family)